MSTEKNAPPPSVRPENVGKPLRFQDIGIWTVMWDENGSWDLSVYWHWKVDRKILGIIPLVWRFILECISVGPSLMSIYLLTTFWSGMTSTIDLYFSSRILDIIQKIIVDRQPRVKDLMTIVLLRACLIMTNHIVSGTSLRAKNKLATRVRYLFEARMIKANLRLDFPTFQDSENASKVNKFFGYGSRGGAWDIFDDLVRRSRGVASVLSQVGFIFGVLSAHPGGGWFALLCISKVALDHLMVESGSPQTSYAWDSNPHYRRMNSLRSIITGKRRRIEIVSNVLANYIHREWTKARKLLGDLSDDYPDTTLYYQKPIILACLDEITQDFPLMFYAYQVLRSSASFSLTSVSLMQQASATLGYTVMGIVNARHSLRDRLEDIKTLYESSHIPNKLLDGDLEYPEPGAEPAAGMEISFENVSFAYPLAENVIKDVSFKIRRGQTVVVVGVNGSGKSTLLKLFNRLYDPASGIIMVDGVPIPSYKSEDLRQASAMLFQHFYHYPLSIRENIRLGLPDENESYEDEKCGSSALDELVNEAARLGGSIDFINEQSAGFDTVLQPQRRSFSASTSNASEAFKKKVEELGKEADVSSGQWQRLALSRLLFRAAGNKVKLICVDEPSASLDPKMEYELFESLRKFSSAKGKTLVFVTHRFGYLTRRADLILVMQKGRLVEQGKHEELLQMNGEYAKLYNVQAKAFLSSDEINEA